MTVDIVTPVRNGQRYIQEAIDTVKAQSFGDWNYFIVNDGSSDNTADIIKRASAQDNRIHYLEQPPLGVSAASNKGTMAGSAVFFAFLDCDDLWHVDKLQKQLAHFNTHPQSNFCFTMLQEFDEPEQLSKHRFRARKDTVKGYSKSSMLCRRQVFDSYGLLDENVQFGDFISWLSQPINKAEVLSVIDETLTYRRVHGENMTATPRKQEYLKVLKQHLDHKRSL